MIKGINKPNIYWDARWKRWSCHWHFMYGGVFGVPMYVSRYGNGSTPFAAYCDMMRNVTAK